MAKYSYITDKTHNNRKIQVESAKRDGSGKNIENNYAKQNGNYQSLTAGLSNNFDTKKVMVDESAYNFRPTATMGSVELEVGSPCKVKKIIGGSVAYNQLISNGNFENTDYWLTSNSTFSVSGNVGTFTANYQYSSVLQNRPALVYGHKYLISAYVKLPRANYSARLGLGDGGYFGAQGVNINLATIGDTNWHFVSTIGSLIQAGTQRAFILMDFNSADFEAIQIKQVNCIDLTQMFGSTIADYIYSLEQANAGSGVAWFKRYFPKEYYAYNSGELVSVKTQGKKITHFNQWDGQYENGFLSTTTGEETAGSGNDKRSLYIDIIGGATYYFKRNADIVGINYGNYYYYDASKNFISYASHTKNATFVTPANARYMRFAFVNVIGADKMVSDLCINFHYDGERDGEYEPYNSKTYPCDDVELRGIPQLDENNNLAFDGDEYANDGNVKRKYGIVDLGTLNYSACGDEHTFYAYLPDANATPFEVCNALVPEYRNIGEASWTQYTNNGDMTIGHEASSKNFYFANRSCSTPAEMKSAMSGVYMVYELETPTDENSIPFTEVQECDNWGTEEWLAPTTDTRPCEVPVGHETDYLPDLKAKLEVAPNTPNENGVYVMEHNASGNTYTLIGAWLTDNGYVKPTSISGYDITKTQTLKNVEGTLTWVDDE